PLGPIKPKISPRLISRSTSLTAAKPPKSLVTLFVRRMTGGVTELIVKLPYLFFPFGPLFPCGQGDDHLFHRRGRRPDSILLLVKPLHHNGFSPQIGAHTRVTRRSKFNAPPRGGTPFGNINRQGRQAQRLGIQ